ncbi:MULTISPECIES: hypothetical protein [Deefgea]|uniref:DUF5610 domain-containing protein n=1 Tax=Deefgea chitinilytica TaxID=570276 RepID=A0ABS2CEY2_9NEIS|nr:MULTISPECIES: hypothetical protein [Deefgea]MBM5572687.1 hypothetical protein [Deefgea chitinilytica]MBM9889923.1 hypothetical protein [Deefgea sp. CFH1-16]
MNSLSALQTHFANGLGLHDSGMAQSLRKMGEPMGEMAKSLSKGGELIGQRVDQLGKATTQMAGDLITQFAQKMFGDQAKGMTIQFDELSLNAESSFTAMQQSSQSAQGSSQASAFRLSDSSSLSAKGTLTTADGQRFEIEIEVRYESVIEGASIAQQRNLDNGYKVIPNTSATSTPIDVVDLNTPTEPVSAARNTKEAEKIDGLKQDFAGTALDLLQRLSSEPVFRPFGLFKPDAEGNNGLQLLGEMSLQLLNLPGGPRYVDLSPEHNPDKKAVDAKV